MSTLLLEGGRLVDPVNDRDEVVDLLIVDGRVAEIGGALTAPEGTESVDVSGKLVTPGFIDMHVHLREPGREDKETVATGTRAAAAGGFTGIACMPNTNPVNDHRAVTQLVIERARQEGVVPVYPIGAVSAGQKGEALAEIGDLVDAGCVAVSDDGYPVATSQLMRKALEYTGIFGIPVIDHCEDCSMTVGASMHEGSVATALGVRGWPSASEEIVVARDLMLAELTAGKLHLAHMSTAGSMRLIRDAKARGLRVTCEVMPHHFALTHEACREYDTNTKMNPPLRSEDDRQALLEAIADGTVDVIATDHAPHHADEKALEFDRAPFGIVGLETAVPLVCTHLLSEHIGVRRMVELLAVNPARVLGLDRSDNGAGGFPRGLGDLAVGRRANVTVIDLEAHRTVDASKFESLSRNTPFDGVELTGWPTLTVVDGEIVWRHSPEPTSR